MNPRRAVACICVVACLGGAMLGGGTATAGSEGKAIAVTTFHAVFVDDTRPSPASTDRPATADQAFTPGQPEEPVRRLDTTITMPKKASKKPLPLVVLAHGADGNPGKFSQLMTAWAQAGYVVAAPLFPRTSNLTGRPVISDVEQQPADVSFVIDQLLVLNRDKESKLFKRFDPKRIALAGLSVGGWTTYGAVFHTCCHDDRVKVAIVMAGLFGSFPNGTYDFTANAVPVLLLHGTNDPFYAHSVEAYPQLASPKYFVTLNGSSHPGPFEDIEDPNDAVAIAATTAFLDGYLKGQKAALGRLVDSVAASNGTATIEQQPR